MPAGGAGFAGAAPLTLLLNAEPSKIEPRSGDL